ncbi:MAG: 30S ribosomal protein S12 methylthiotransferase RimO [Lachnospiraceae bacterium]|nr:30S ribosomal protein S12 methylthiotransferase RimO [Lachnospiraceae bacterium]
MNGKGVSVFVMSFGCDKNLSDTEHMLGIMASDGYGFTQDESEADVIVINTCCFINDAKQESIDAILEMAEYKSSGRCRALIVTGCLGERYRDEIIKEIPEVDAILGTAAYDDIERAVEAALAGKRLEDYKPLNYLPEDNKGRLLTTGGHFAYLKIAEGCDKHCTYCIIPKIRGSFRSVPIERLVGEATDLAERGVKELILVAQETTVYGKDLYGKKSLGRLLGELNKIQGLRWIRIMYCYPEEIDDNLIDAIMANDKVCHYLDIPIQHANDTILKRMGRKTDKADLTRVIEHLRERIPDICIRTTLITGFPGESQEQHEELMQFVNDMEFDRLGVFKYSPEEDTPAASFPDQVSDEEKERRFKALMELQQEVVCDMAGSFIGKTMKVMIEGRMTDEEDNVYVGRTYRDAPDIDGLIFVRYEGQLMSGDIVNAKITASDYYDLIGEVE